MKPSFLLYSYRVWSLERLHYCNVRKMEPSVHIQQPFKRVLSVDGSDVREKNVFNHCKLLEEFLLLV